VGRFILVIAALALHVYVLIDLVRSPSAEVRLLPKWLWLLVWLLPIAGPLCYLLAGQPRVEPGQGGGGGGGGGITGGPRPRGPVAPDDDPEFLKRLDEQSWAARMERLRRERGITGSRPDSTDGAGSAGREPTHEEQPGEAPSDRSG
jgi:hypothetical protein